MGVYRATIIFKSNRGRYIGWIFLKAPQFSGLCKYPFHPNEHLITCKSNITLNYFLNIYDKYLYICSLGKGEACNQYENSGLL